MDNQWKKREERKWNESDSWAIQNRFQMLREPRHFYGFDRYLVMKWGEMPAAIDFVDCDEKEQTKIRKQACRNLNQKIRGEKVADAHTIRKWFGLGGITKPNRDTFFRLAFALRLSPGEAQEYLVKGMLVPEIQINDHREIIYLYGLENKLAIDVCDKIIELVEREMNRDVVLEQNTHTEQLRRMYEKHRHDSTEDFTLWMCENAGMFKGYRKTALNAFVHLKEEIQRVIRQEAFVCLQGLLQETGYGAWTKARGTLGEIEENLVREYVKQELRHKNPSITEETAESIRWFTGIAFGEDKNSDFIGELYAAAMVPEGNSKKRYREKESYRMPRSIQFMTDKQLSQLLTVAEQKERLLRLQQIWATLQEMAENDECPSWIRERLQNDYGKENIHTVAEAKKELAYRLRHQKQRCQLIGREDLLPLLHYVAQRRYLVSIGENLEQYDRQEAMAYFETLANTTLLACQMAPVSPEYELDYLLLSGFCENDMYSLSDLIDEAEREG